MTARALVLVLISGITAGCVTGETFHANVLGQVVDATTAAPLAAVEIRSREATTVSGSDGRYRLSVARGLRELVFTAPGRAPIRKLVVVREPREPAQLRDIRLDVLVPNGPTSAGKRLVVQRGYRTDARADGLPLETGDSTLVSVMDELGNAEQALVLGLPMQVHRPVWAPGQDAIYYNVDIPGKTQATRFDLMGVHRFDLATGARIRVWGGKYRDTHVAAVAPDGSALLALTNQEMYLIQNLTQPARESTVSGALEVPGRRLSFTSVAWGPSAFVHLTLGEDLGSGSLTQARLVRLEELTGGRERVRVTELASSTSEYFDHPLPLSDGRLLYAYGDRAGGASRGIRLRNTNGSTEELLPGAWIPVALEDGILLYIQDHDLHRRDLSTGRDFAIVQGAEWAAWR